MKIEIGRNTFFIVIFLILLFPLSTHWDLLLFGKSTTGTVVPHKRHPNHSQIGLDSKLKTLKFNVDGKSYYADFPNAITYDMDSEHDVFYNIEDPKENLIISWQSLYFGKYMIIPAIILFIWLAVSYAFWKKREPRY